jgi:GST-like protein
VDPDGPGGTALSVFESGAILIYLGKKTGKFWPADLRRQVPVLEWLMWQMGGFGPIPGQVHHFLQVSDEQDRRYGLERYSKETRRLYGVLDRRLGEVEFTGGDISIADFAILGWAWRHERHQVDLADFPNVKRWYGAMMARPGVERGFAVALS